MQSTVKIAHAYIIHTFCFSTQAFKTRKHATKNNYTYEKSQANRNTTCVKML